MAEVTYQVELSVRERELILNSLLLSRNLTQNATVKDHEKVAEIDLLIERLE